MEVVLAGSRQGEGNHFGTPNGDSSLGEGGADIKV